MSDNFFSSISGFGKNTYQYETKDKETDYSEVDYTVGIFGEEDNNYAASSNNDDNTSIFGTGFNY